MKLRHTLGKALLLLAACMLAGCGKDNPTALIASSKSYIAKDEYDAGIIQLKSALQIAPNNAEARVLYGKALLDTGRPAAAETEIRKAIELKHPADETYPLLARALVDQGAYAKAVAELADRKLGDPKAQAGLQTELATAYVALGDVSKANEAVTAALAVVPGDPRALTVQARIAALGNDLPRALTLIDAALATAPNYTEALIVKAGFQHTQGRRDDALKTLEHAVEVSGGALGPRYALASLLVEAGQQDKAAAQVDAMKKMSPLEFRTLYADAMVSYSRGDAAHAREAIQPVLSVNPDNLQSVYLSGLIDLKLGLLASAEDSLRKVVSKAPGEASPLRALAGLYLRTGRIAQGIETLETGLRSAPDNPVLLQAAGEANLAAGNTVKAAQYYERASALDEGNMASKVRLAQVKYAAGESGQAFKELESLSGADQSQYQADLALIAAHLRRGEFDQALAAVATLEKKQPNNPMTYNVKGAAYAGMRDSKNARASFEKALEVQPGYFAAARNLALLDIQEQKTDDARKRYEAMLAKEPKNEQVLLGLAEVLVMSGHSPDEVKATIERAINAAPKSIRPRLALINYLGNLRDTKGALDAAKAVQAAFPDDTQVLEAVGVAQRAAGQNEDALATFKRLVELQPQNASALMRLADAEVAQKNYNAGIATLRKLIAADPKQNQALIALAKTFVISGHPEDAIAEARKLQKDRPNVALGYALEGEVLAAQAKWPQAAAAYRDALAREPVPLIAVRRYEALQKVGAADASAFAAQWAKDHPTDITLVAFLAQQSLARKDYRAAIANYQVAIKLDPDNPVILNNLAWALAETGDPRGREYAATAYRQAPFNPNVIDTLGWAEVQGGDAKKGVELLKSASNLAPGNHDIRLHLAKGLIKTGDKAGAKKALEPLSRLDAASPARVDAEKLLSGL
ncbi:MAG: XrtA/PEP-CTERM system TPR-repeat protein PrsT [Betaproteobacteria bacterium]